MLHPNFSAVPAGLVGQNRWLVWRDAKIPYCATAPRMKASSTNPDTWASFSEAQIAFEEGGFSGVGFALNGDGIVGVDLDKCVLDGHPMPEALTILNDLGCQYIELSPSGKGLRGFGYGPNIKGVRGRLSGVAVELYSTARYMTVTGHVLYGEALSPLRGFDTLADALRSRPTERTECTEATEGYRDDSSHSSVISVLSVGHAIQSTIPCVEGERNRCLFQFARMIKRMMPNATQSELRSYAQQWHEAALPNIGTKDFSVTWYDFNRGFQSVRYPAGATLRQIVGEIDRSSEIPDRISELGYGSREIYLFLICQRLQQQAGDGPFFLASRQAGELLGVHFTDAAKMLWTLKADGILQEVSKGCGNRASRYRLVL